MDETVPAQGSLIPLRPRPEPDESLSSWLSRLARENGVSVYYLLHRVASAGHLAGGDIDWTLPERVNRKLAAKTGLGPRQILALTLQHQARSARLADRANRRLEWLLPTCTRGGWHQGRGYQYCPECLAVDGLNPYFRRIWRLSFVTICPEHGRLLLDSCPVCDSPVNFHKSAAPLPDHAHCPRCFADLRRAPPDDIGITNPSLRLQARLLEALTCGWSLLAGRPVMLQLQFSGILRIARPVLTGFPSTRLLDACRSNFGIELPGLPMPGERFNRQRCSLRYLILSAIGALLEDWPTRFETFCRRYRLWRTQFYSTDETPFWLNSRLLNTKPYWTSEAEARNAMRWLVSNGYAVSRANLASALGNDRSMKLSARLQQELARRAVSQRHLRPDPGLTRVFHSFTPGAASRRV